MLTEVGPQRLDVAGAGVERETTEPREAYARFPPGRLTRYRDGWLPD